MKTETLLNALAKCVMIFATVETMETMAGGRISDAHVRRTVEKCQRLYPKLRAEILRRCGEGEEGEPLWIVT